MAGFKESFTFYSCIIILLVASLHFGEPIKCFECLSNSEITFNQDNSTVKVCGQLTLNNTVDLIECQDGVTSCVKIDVSNAPLPNGQKGSAIFRYCGKANGNFCDTIDEPSDGTNMICHHCQGPDGCNV